MPDAWDSEQTVARFLAQFSTTNRAEAIHLALQAYGSPVTSLRGLTFGGRRWALWSPVVLFVMSFVFLLVSMERALDVYDEGIIMYGAARVQGGAIPYRDFWTLYGPGQYYVLAGLFQIFGSWVLVERLWDLAVRAAISVLVFSQVSTLTSRWCGIGALVVAVLWLGAYRSYGFPVFPALLFTGGGAYLLAEYFRGTRQRSTLVLSGLGVGLATLFRHDIGFLACLTGALLLSSRRLATEPAAITWSRRLVVAARELIPYVLGIGLILVPTAAALLLAVPLGDFLLPLVVYPVTVYPRVRSLPFPEFPNPILVLTGAKNVAWLSWGVGTYFPLLVSFTALGILLRRQLSSARHRALSAGEWIVLHFAILVPALYLKGLVRIGPVHLAPAFIIAVILFFTLLDRVPSRFRLTRCAIMLLGVLVMGFPVVGPLAHSVASNLDLSIRHEPLRRLRHMPATLRAACQAPHGLERARCLSVDRAQALAIGYVLGRVPAGQFIYVGNWRHDRIIASDAMFYFLVDRAAPTKYFDMIPGLQTTRPIQERLIRDLMDRDVRLVVLCSLWENAQEANDSARSSGVTLLDGYIQDHYRLVTRFGNYTVLERTLPDRHLEGISGATPHTTRPGAPL